MESEFMKLCQLFTSSSDHVSLAFQLLEQHEKYTKQDFISYFTPILDAYEKSDQYVSQCYFKMTGSWINYNELPWEQCMRTLPILIHENIEKGSFHKIVFKALVENEYIQTQLLKQVEKLDLSYHNLDTWPAFIFEASSLKTLNLFGNADLKDLPPPFFKLTQLQELTLQFRELEAIPNEIKSLQALRRLYLTSFRILHLPESLRHLKNLESLILSIRELSEIPLFIFQMEQLKTLTVFNSNLKSLPSAIADLENLKELKLENNSIETIPEEIGQLKQLKRLNLRANRLTQLPESILELQQLSELNLSYNNLSESQINYFKEKLPNCSIEY